MCVLQHATELVKTAASRYDEYVNVKDLSDKITRALTAAKKDNDFIYHDRVPEVKDLEHIGKASLVKSTAIQTALSQKFTGQNDAHMTFILFGFFGVISHFLGGNIQQIALFSVLFGFRSVWEDGADGSAAVSECSQFQEVWHSQQTDWQHEGSNESLQRVSVAAYICSYTSLLKVH